MAARIATLAASSLVILAHGAAALKGQFNFPVKEGLKVYQFDTVNVSYTVNVDKPSLWTFCSEKDEDGNDYVAQKRIIRDTRDRDGWELVYIDFSTTATDCWFNIREEDGVAGKGINSVHFSMSDSERSKETYGVNQPASTTSAAPSSTSSPPPTSTASKPASTSQPGNNGKKGDGDHDDSSSGGGLSSGAKAGIGVGVALGVLAVLGGVAAVLIRRKRRMNHVYGGVPKGDEAEKRSAAQVQELPASHAQAPQEMAA